MISSSTWNAVSYQEDKPERGLHILDRAAELQDAGVRMYPQISPRSLWVLRQRAWICRIMSCAHSMQQKSTASIVACFMRGSSSSPR